MDASMEDEHHNSNQDDHQQQTNVASLKASATIDAQTTLDSSTKSAMIINDDDNNRNNFDSLNNKSNNSGGSSNLNLKHVHSVSSGRIDSDKEENPNVIKDDTSNDSDKQNTPNDESIENEETDVENEDNEDEDEDEDEEDDDDDEEEDDDEEDEETDDQMRYMGSDAPIGNTGKSVDPTELQMEGLLSQYDYKAYKILENFLYFYDRYPFCTETFKKVLKYILEESNIFCWFLMVPECYNKLMKEQLSVPRDICRRLSSLESPTKIQLKIIEDAKKEIYEVKDEVVETTDKLVKRLDEHFENMTPQLHQKYRYVLLMIRSICLKIKADLQRYVAECETGEERIRLGLEASQTYQEAQDGFCKIPGHNKNPYYLSNVLNFAVNKVDILKDLDSGISMVNSAFDAVFNHMTKKEFNDNFICNILELLRNNSHAWTALKFERQGES